MHKKLLAVAVSSALAMPMAAQAVKFKTSGQVNRAIMFGDDGQGSDVLQVDGDASGSRFRFKGSEDIGNGMKVGFNFELEAQSNDSFNATIKQGGTSPGEAPAADGAFKHGERHINVWFSGNWGKVTLGQGSVATDNVAKANLNNAWLAVENDSDYGAGILFRTSAGGTAGGINAQDVTPSYDGDRNDNLRYDSPALGPFTAAVSVSNNEAWDAMGKVAGSVGGGDYDVRFGYGDYEARSGFERWTVSGAFKFSQGTSVGLAYGTADFDTSGVSDGDYFYVKLGHDWGNNSVAIDYKTADDTIANASCSGGSCGGETFGIGFVHTMPKPKVDLYAGYRNFELDDWSTALSGGSGADDIDVFFVGSRVKFD
jgi:predicted porin